MGSEWELGSSSEIIVSLEDFNGHVGKCAEGFESAHGGMVMGKKCRRKKIVGVIVMKESCAWQTLGLKRQTKEKITYSAGECETEIDFVLVGEKHRKYTRDVKVIPWELQHRLVVVDLDQRGPIAGPRIITVIRVLESTFIRSSTSLV